MSFQVDFTRLDSWWVQSIGCYVHVFVCVLSPLSGDNKMPIIQLQTTHTQIPYNHLNCITGQLLYEGRLFYFNSHLITRQASPVSITPSNSINDTDTQFTSLIKLWEPYGKPHFWWYR